MVWETRFMSQIFQRLRQKRSSVSHVYPDGGETGPALAFRAVLQFGPPHSDSVACSLRRRRRSNSRLDVIKRFVHVASLRRTLASTDLCFHPRLRASCSNPGRPMGICSRLSGRKTAARAVRSAPVALPGHTPLPPPKSLLKGWGTMKIATTI